ncbi:unnamed protein product, partial [Laminaria digitata]
MEHTVGGAAAGGGASTIGRPNPRSSTVHPRQRRQRQRAEGIHLSVPVAFGKQLTPEDSAFLLAEVLRHVLFIRGQLPMPSRQLLKASHATPCWPKREERDKVAAEEAAAVAAARVSQEVGTGEGGSSSGLRPAAPLSRKKAKGGRSLARATAHRRARKTLSALEETTANIDQAFADAASKETPVLEALVLLGASHLSPREIYSVTFPEYSAGACGNLAGVGVGRNDGGNGGGARRKISADACSRKLVRCLVGGMSGVTFRGLGSCRVHIFLRLGDAPARDLHAVRAVPAASAVPVGAEDTTRSGSRMRGNNPTHASAGFPHGGGSQAPPHTPTFIRLTPRPGFKIRVSRSRPAPKVSIMLSTVTASNNEPRTTPNRGGAAGSVLDEAPRQGQRQGQPKVEGEGEGGGCRAVAVSFEGGKGRG